MVRLGIDRAKELRRRAHVVRLAEGYLRDEVDSLWTAKSLREIAARWEAEAAQIEEGPK